ncbi:MAG TPA: hypothetical protein VNR00_14785 [Opitutus sp.]|nr:hypothetical protein [Opitutus sp.]
MRLLFRVVFSTIVFTAAASLAGADQAAAPARVFDYDRSASLDLREIGRESRDDAVIQDVTFTANGDAIPAYIVRPSGGRRSLAGVLYVHWLGLPATTNRTQFLNEAVALASQGVVSVLVEAMWAAPKWYENRVPEEDYSRSVQQVIALRRAMQLLVQQPDVDPQRIGFVGHDFGAMYGIIAGALDGRARTYVLMAGTPRFADWYLFAHQPKDLGAYRAQMAPLDPIRFLGQLAPASVFFQFAARDEYVSAAAAAESYAAAAPRKQCATYDAGHDLQATAVAADRITWLLRELAPR